MPSKVTPVLDNREELVRRAQGLTGKIAGRAAGYDQNIEFPAADFDDLQAAGLLATAVPQIHGGHGISMSNGDPMTQWRITTAIAAGDLSLGRCYEGHVNSIDLINAFARDDLKRSIYPALVRGDMRLVIWGSELVKADTQNLAQRLSGQTEAKPVDGGWRLTGAKLFATSAGGATHVIVTAAIRNPDLDPLEQQQWFLVDANAPGITIDTSWWRSLGMRATVSHRVALQDVFVPDEARLFSTRQYLAGFWQARFIPHFSASFLGAATAAYEFALSYVKGRGRTEDPIVQHCVAQMRVAVDLLRSHLEHTARLWQDCNTSDGALTSNLCRIVGEQQSMEVVQTAIRICGASALLENYPLGRIMRDLQTYVRHESIDRIMCAVGKGCLGLDYDANFARSGGSAAQ